MPGSDPTQRFTARVDSYVAARPSYPDAVATELARWSRLPAGATVADLGCGTGLSCVPFLRAGFRVIGVEPNDAMRAAGEAYLAGSEAFRAVAGRAEATTLPDASVDLVVAAQAAHWFDLPAARAEARRILRRPAHAALLWNDRPSVGSAFAEGYEDLLRTFGDGYEDIRRRHGDETVAEFFGDADHGSFEVANPSRLDLATLLERVASASYMPGPDSPTYGPMVERLRALFDATAVDGTVEMPLTTRVYVGVLESS